MSFIYWIFFSKFFVLKTIQFKGFDNLNESWIIEKKILNFIDFKIGNNIFLQKIIKFKKEKLLKKNFFQFDKININISLPNTIVINVKEKKPIIIALQEEGKYLLIDKKGEVLDIIEKTSKYSLPIFTSYVFSKNITIKENIVENSLQKSINLLNKFSNQDIELISEIIFENEISSIYLLNSNIKIILNDDSNINKKIDILKYLINNSKIFNKSISYLDISIPDKPIIKE